MFSIGDKSQELLITLDLLPTVIMERNAKIKM